MTSHGLKTAKKAFALLLSYQFTITMLPYRNARHPARTRYNSTGQRFILVSLLWQSGAQLWNVTVRRLSHRSPPLGPNMSPSPMHFLRLYFRLQNCHVYVLSSKRTLENGRGSLYVTDYNGPTIWAGLIINGKSGTRGKGQTSGNIPLWKGPFDPGTGYMQKF
jgi:hypothetical protein